ncbi:MAG TPA: MFS transporter [Steroidobacteraceae bacterium]
MTTQPLGTSRRPPAHAAPRRVALTVAGALFMEGFDGAVILTSLPQMAADLHESALRLTIAVTAYLLALAILIPISGWVADRFGARRVYCASILVFVAGSLSCGFSHSIVSLVLGRLVQGMGGAMMSPVGRLILTRGVEKRELVSVMNYMLLPGIVGPTVGPVVGGFITTYASWRWNFFINVPIGVLGLIMAWRFIPSSPPVAQARFDWLGFLLVGGAAAGLQILIEGFGHRFLPAPALVALGTLVAVCGGLYVRHAHRRVAPLIEPALFRIRSFSVAILAGSVARAGVFSTQILLPDLLQLQFGYSAFHSGLLTFLVSAGVFVVRPFISFMLAHFGFRRALFWGCTLASAMLVGFTQFYRSSPVALFAAYILLFGTVRSAIFSSIGALSLADIEHADMGRSNGVSLFAQRISMSFGVSLGAAALSLASAGGTLEHRDFSAAFLIASAITLIAAFGMLRLRDGDGWQVSGFGRRAAQS